VLPRSARQACAHARANPDGCRHTQAEQKDTRTADLRLAKAASHGSTRVLPCALPRFEALLTAANFHGCQQFNARAIARLASAGRRDVEEAALRGRARHVPADLMELYKATVEQAQDLRPSYSVAPTQQVYSRWCRRNAAWPEGRFGCRNAAVSTPRFVSASAYRG
jgi:hypothetical protein